MNARKFLILMAATALEQVEEPQCAALARQLRAINIPVIDGGGFRFMRRIRPYGASGGDWYQLSRWYQNLSADHNLGSDFVELAPDERVEIIFSVGLQLTKGTVTYDVTTGALPDSIVGECAAKS